MALKVDDAVEEFNGAAAAKKYVRFWTLVAGMLFFFGCHNYVQDLIMSLPGFKAIM